MKAETLLNHETPEAPGSRAVASVVILNASPVGSDKKVPVRHLIIAIGAGLLILAVLLAPLSKPFKILCASVLLIGAGALLYSTNSPSTQ